MRQNLKKWGYSVSTMRIPPAVESLQAPASQQQQQQQHRHQKQNSPQYRPRILYFSVFCWISITTGRFLAPFLKQIAAWDASEIGLCLAVVSVVGSVSGSWAGVTADRLEAAYPGTGRAGCLLAGVVLGTLLFLLHSVPLFSTTGSTDETTASDEEEDDNYIARTIWHMGIRLAFAVVTSFVFPVMDGMALHYLETCPGRNTQEYGQERLYGAISWALTNLVIAPCIDSFGFGVFYPASVVSGVFVVVTLYLYVSTNSSSSASMTTEPSLDATTVRLRKHDSDMVLPNDDDDDDGDDGDDDPYDGDVRNDNEATKELDSIPLTALVKIMAGTVYGAAFLVTFLILSAGQVVVDALVFLYFERLGSTYLIMGCSVVLTVLFEIPIFHVAPVLLQRYGSGALLFAAGVCYVIRVIGYSYISPQHVAYVLLLEPLHGVTYACGQTASVDFCARCMPAGYQASGQGLVGLVRGVGSVIGLLLGGWAIDAVGPRIMYRSSAAVVALGMACFALATRFHSAPQFDFEPRHVALSQNEVSDDETNETDIRASFEMAPVSTMDSTIDNVDNTGT